MSVSDWEEVKRLAADFQRAQLSAGAQRLSERNCIEIINKLIASKKLEVVFTKDGKEYITPQHLVKEIKDELQVHNGRINFVELSKILSVDLSLISAKATEIEKLTGSISIINGHLIDNSYILSVCEEINDMLKMTGQVTIAELTTHYDLPGDFLLTVVEKQLGKIIKAEQDKTDNRVFYTEDFKKRNCSIVRGALLALTKPTPVPVILGLCNMDERLFYSSVSTLSESKTLVGAFTGKEGTNSDYIPSVYMKSQMEWVRNFYDQNGYLEYTTLNRLGISNPITFIKKHFGDSDLMMLSSCAIGSLIVDQVEGAVEDIISTASFIDILYVLPSVAEAKDAEVILDHILKKKSFQNLHIFNSSVAVTDQYLRNLMKIFEQKIDTKARGCLTDIRCMLNQGSSHKGGWDDDKFESKADRKEERRKKAAEGKGGGGTQGRETKTKSTKKKYMKNAQHDNDSDDDSGRGKKGSANQKLEIISLEEVKEILRTDQLLQEEDSEELIEAVAEHLLPKINQAALEAAKKFYESTIAATNQGRRKKHNELEEKLNDLVLKVRLFEKGYKQFPSKDVQQQLAKYLLKSICTDITNEIFTYVVQDDAKFEGREMTNELRTKILNSLPNDLKETLTTLNKSLSSSSVDDFLNVIDDAVGPGFCDILLKKYDKKKERPQLIEQRQQLVDQLNVANDPALVLHLASLVLFQEATQTMLHASGRFVSTILPFLQPSLSVDDFNTLQRYHDLVLKALTASDPEEKSSAEKMLQEEMPSVKRITVSFKKSYEKRSE